ncbi:hypothetical protein [Microbacterium jejuense]|uniref:hypothetical protein n=1 Tax=Microbacterium jejuense TaxID=1263637 RepID=UPI0031EB48B7
MTADSRAVSIAMKVSPDLIYGAATVTRDIEDAALTEVDRPAFDRVVPIDRRFDKELRALRDELREREERLPEHPEVGDRVALDLWGFLAAAVAFGIVMAGMSSAFTGPLAAWVATACAVLALALHAGNAWLTRAEPPNRNTAGYLGLSTVLLGVSAGVSLLLAPGLWAAFVLLAVCTIVVAALTVRAIIRWQPVARGIAAYKSALSGLTDELGERLAQSAAQATADWDEAIAALSPEQRAEFERSRADGLAAFAARDDVVRPVGFDQNSPSGRVRYAGVKL